MCPDEDGALACTEKPYSKGKWNPQVGVTKSDGTTATEDESGPGAILEIYFKIMPWTIAKSGQSGNAIKMESVLVLVPPPTTFPSPLSTPKRPPLPIPNFFE